MFKFKHFSRFNDVLIHGLSTRHGGVSPAPFKSLNLGFQYDDPEENVWENYRIFCADLGVDSKSLVLPMQAHTDEIVVVGEADAGRVFENVDAFVCAVPGVPVAVRFADCQGVFLFDPFRRIVAAVHSGWRGNAQNIIGKCVRKMVELGSVAENILAGISPSLGPCCAEFSEPLLELPKEMHKYVDGKHVDLWQCAVDQLAEEGVTQIELAAICTCCNTDDFFSYRAEPPITGRMAGLIMLK